MKTIIALMLGCISFSSLAQEMNCLDKLLPFSRHSGLHQVSKEEWQDSRDMMDAESAARAVLVLTERKLMCKSEEITVKLTPVCHKMISDLGQSNVCYVFTNLGYFVISKDAGKNTNFIFNKDRLFTEPTE